MFEQKLIFMFTFSKTSIFSWVCSSKMLFDRARMISNLNSIIGRTISKNSLTLVPWIWGKIWNQGKGLTQISFIRKMHIMSYQNIQCSFLTWVNDFPVVWITMSGPNDMINGKRENKYDDAIAGNLASSRNNAELIFAFCVLSNWS